MFDLLSTDSSENSKKIQPVHGLKWLVVMFVPERRTED